MRIEWFDYSSGYVRLALAIPVDSNRMADMDAVKQYLRTAWWMPVQIWAAVCDVDKEQFHVGKCWDYAGVESVPKMVAFTTSSVCPTDAVVQQTMDILADHPNAVVIAHRLDVTEDGGLQYNPCALGDWLAMTTQAYRDGERWPCESENGLGHYLEFEYLARLYLSGRPIYLLKENVVHLYHESSADTETNQRCNQEAIVAVMERGLPRIWWRWPEEPWLEYSDRAEPMKIIRC